jgi:type 2 lantibiotic biosynthesis protein LanM
VTDRPDRPPPRQPGHDSDAQVRALGRLIEPATADLAAQLAALSGLSAAERTAVHAGAATAVRDVVWRQVHRVVVLELNLARLAGTLTADDPAARWDEWINGLARPGGWKKLAAPYPALLPRLRTLIGNRCAAALTLARRYARDRAAVATLPGAPDELAEVTFGAGDSHRGGQTVTLLRGSNGDRDGAGDRGGAGAGFLVYKPRPVGVDDALRRLLPRLLPDTPPQLRIRVPAVIQRTDRDGDYGWAEHVAHRYCDGDDDLRSFYRGLGHWLAVMRLLAGSDLHSENVVACGPVPVVVDCETLFTPQPAAKPSGYGAAVDTAADRISQSVLRTGLLPGRGAVLGWRGVDPSAAGFLPGQQPAVQVPTIVDHGTDRARIGTVAVAPQATSHLPSAEPDLGRHWQSVVDGFTDLTARMRDLDRAGDLEPMLADFAGRQVRVVLRDTATYAELTRMLWHPGSLHDPEPAAQWAAELLARQAMHRPGAPDDRTVIDAEVADLLIGDVPMFVTEPRSGELSGPGGSRWGTAEDLVAAAVRRWRRADIATERRVVQTTLVAAYTNDGSLSGRERLPTGQARRDDLDRRRRALSAAIVRRTIEVAVRGDDGTATWVAPVLDSTGYAVRPMGQDLYGGLGGVAVTLAAYLREVGHGRADDVPGAGDLLAAVLRTLRMADEQQAAHRAEAAAAGIAVRPSPPGGYVGLGSQIWSWLLLHRLGAVGPDEAVQRAATAAALLPDAVAADDTYDLLGGAAGAVAPLLGLAALAPERQDRWLGLAWEIGQVLQDRASRSGAVACWPNRTFADGGGGLAHGVTGIGWALSRLADADADADGGEAVRELAEAAFAWEETLYDPQRGTWYDARAVNWGEPPLGWCNGAVGIGICAADRLDRGDDPGWRDMLGRAARAAWPDAFGANYTLCHGDVGSWELLDRALVAGVGPAGLAREQVTAQVVSNLETYGPTTEAGTDVFAPGMFIGAGGVAYQLLRMDPGSDLPSVLLPDPDVS